MYAAMTGWRTLVDAPEGAAAKQRSYVDLPPFNSPHHAQPVVHCQAILQRLLQGRIALATLQRMAQPGAHTPILCQRQKPTCAAAVWAGRPTATCTGHCYLFWDC